MQPEKAEKATLKYPDEVKRLASALVLVASSAALVGLPPAMAGDGGIVVTRTSEAITVTGTGGVDEVKAMESSGQFVFTSEQGITSSDCSQDDVTQVSCLASPLVIFRGRSGSDSFTSSLPVSTEQSGGIGRDTLKGGPQDDLLKGQDGRDTLRGRGGPDQLVGGRGTDDCAGGGGTDSVTSCE